MTAEGPAGEHKRALSSAEKRVAQEALYWARQVKTLGDRAWCRMVEHLEWNTYTPVDTTHLFDGGPADG